MLQNACVLQASGTSAAPPRQLRRHSDLIRVCVPCASLFKPQLEPFIGSLRDPLLGKILRKTGRGAHKAPPGICADADLGEEYGRNMGEESERGIWEESGHPGCPGATRRHPGFFFFIHPGPQLAIRRRGTYEQSQNHVQQK